MISFNKLCHYPIPNSLEMNRKIDFDNKTILITGGAGFIGSNLALYIQNNFPKSKIIVFDCFRNSKTFPNGNLMSFGHYQNLIDFKGEIICGNINNNADLSLLNSYSFDYIFHHAAISDTRVYDQEIIMRTNVNSFYNILKIAKTNNASLIFCLFETLILELLRYAPFPFSAQNISFIIGLNITPHTISPFSSYPTDIAN